MEKTLLSINPNFIPPMEPDFLPAVDYNRAYRQAVEASGDGIPLSLALERVDGTRSHYGTQIFPPSHPLERENAFYIERILKFLLWQRGGWKVFIAGSDAIGAFLRSCYSPTGRRAFDHQFMGEAINQRPFTIIETTFEAMPESNETQRYLGRHLDGCRIGFDLGASDIKVSAVIEGQAVFTHEMEWNPRDQVNPNYHYDMIISAVRLATEKLPRVDAVGGSSAGVIINNRPMVASIFRGIPPERYDEVRDLFLRLQRELGVPLEVVNDGEVSALAGSMSLGENAILGIAMGSSLAAGYVTRQGNLTNWLDELAFAPIDYSLSAPVDEWSADRGVGAVYMSQQCVFRLAPKAGIVVPPGLSLAQKLRFVQEKLEAGDDGARKIWESIGIFLGYAVAHYADFYDLGHVQVLGRVTSGLGGTIILAGAQRVLDFEFPEASRRIRLSLPDELSRRLGQSIAAASIPILCIDPPKDNSN